MCTKIITEKNWLTNLKRQCDRPEHQDGLCTKHFKQLQAKTTNWELRPGYIVATEKDLVLGRPLRRFGTCDHNTYVHRNGLIYQKHEGAKLPENKFQKTKFEPKPELFCVIDRGY